MVFLDSLLGMFSIDMGIDLGTCNTLVCIKSEGIVLNEPTVVAVKKGTNRVLQNGNAVGLVAKEMLGKTPGSITAIRPLKDGVISDFEMTEEMLRHEGDVEADEQQPELPFAETLAQPAPEHLGPPVEEAGEDREDHAAEQGVVEVRDDEVAVVHLPVDRKRREVDPRQPADDEER